MIVKLEKMVCLRVYMMDVVLTELLRIRVIAMELVNINVMDCIVPRD